MIGRYPKPFTGSEATRSTRRHDRDVTTSAQGCSKSSWGSAHAIDELVNETSRSVAQRLVTEQGFFLETSDNAVFNPLVRSLTPEQRQLLGDTLLHERWGAIHDVLAVLTWWMSSEGLSFTFQGEPMPVELSGLGLHGDFVGRRQGWEWPSNGGPLDT